jgi:hypothetical protein
MQVATWKWEKSEFRPHFWNLDCHGFSKKSSLWFARRHCQEQTSAEGILGNQ